MAITKRLEGIDPWNRLNHSSRRLSAPSRKAPNCSVLSAGHPGSIRDRRIAFHRLCRAWLSASRSTVACCSRAWAAATQQPLRRPQSSWDDISNSPNKHYRRSTAVFLESFMRKKNGLVDCSDLAHQIEEGLTTIDAQVGLVALKATRPRSPPMVLSPSSIWC